MNCFEEELALVKKMFVNNGEYEFNDERKGNKFAKELLSNIKDKYESEGYHHKHETLKEFIYTSEADREAYWLYEEKYSN